MKLLFGIVFFGLAITLGHAVYTNLNTDSPEYSIPVSQHDIAISSLQNQVLRATGSKVDQKTGDTYHSWETLGGRFNITVSRGKYTLLTMRDKSSGYIEVVEVGMDGRVISGFSRSGESDKIRKEYIAPTAAKPAGKGLEFQSFYEQLAENLLPAFYNYFGVDTTGNKWGI